MLMLPAICYELQLACLLTAAFWGNKEERRGVINKYIYLLHDILHIIINATRYITAKQQVYNKEKKSQFFIYI